MEKLDPSLQKKNQQHINFNWKIHNVSLISKNLKY